MATASKFQIKGLSEDKVGENNSKITLKVGPGSRRHLMELIDLWLTTPNQDPVFRKLGIEEPLLPKAPK